LDNKIFITGKPENGLRVGEKKRFIMSAASRTMIYVISALTAVMILIFAAFKLTIPIDSITAVVVTSSAICLITLAFVLYAAIKNSRDVPFPLGLSSGSIRALIAVLSLMFFMTLSLLVYFNTKDNDIAKSILTTVSTLAIAVSSFYFGSKATEQGSKIAGDVFDKAIKSQEGSETVRDVPASVIELALSTNKEKWKKDYDCIDIVVGQKQTQNTTHNLSCLVFVVESKNRQGKPPIPGTIPFISQGQTYNIPTDVRSRDEVANQNSAVDTTDAEAELPIEDNTDRKASE
jgi:hypothetical protein